ncbi:hypothetical protein [Streptomyces sp. NPDC003077]|uniref:hypothetical protein n=1 Tax=Streptomyces sp. NPDC003077 TaxID=3154443 RepID=UPI0033AA9560
MPGEDGREAAGNGAVLPAHDAHDTARGIARVEGYLLWQAERDRARAEAEEFADRMPWLTTAQREEVTRLYREQRLVVARQVLRAIADRCEELREEYTARYETLRRRLVRAGVATLLGAVALFVCALTLVSAR